MATTRTATQPAPFMGRGHQAYTTPPNSQGAPSPYGIAQNYQQQQQQQQHYHHQQHLQQQQRSSPTHIGAHANAFNSPASPHFKAPPPHPDLPSLPLATRDTRIATYIPAALRPTDPPVRAQPLTPPRSLHGSSDDLRQTSRTSRPVSRRSVTIPSFTSSISAQPSRLSHISPTDLATAQNSIEDLPPITGPPSRENWKPDANAAICDHPICHKKFGLFERRHHCRHCGDVFCNTHSSERVPMDQNTHFHPKGSPERCCDYCAKEWVSWVEDRVRKTHGDEISSAADREEATDAAGPMTFTGRKNGDEAHRNSAIAGSVSNEWSTF